MLLLYCCILTLFLLLLLLLPICAQQNRFLESFCKQLSTANKDVLSSVASSATIAAAAATTAESADAASASAADSVKKWIRLSRVVIGLPFISYSE